MPATDLSNVRYEVEHVRALFDQLAPAYAIHPWLSLGLSEQWRRWAVGCLALPPGATVVDLMCGSGEMWPHLESSLISDGRIIGVDLSGAMLSRAACRAERLASAGRIELLQASALTAPLGAGEADAVLCAFGLKTLDPSQWKELLVAMRRLLRPGSIGVIIDLLPRPGSFTEALIRGWLRACRPWAREVVSPLLDYLEADAVARETALTEMAAHGGQLTRLIGGGLGVRVVAD